MKYSLSLIFIVVMILVGCGESDIQGNAFIITGNGDIKAAAGKTVYLIPEKSVNSLLTRAVNDVSPEILKSYKEVITSLCALAKDSVVILDKTTKKELKIIKDRGNIPLSGCSSLQNNAEKLNRVFKSIKSKHFKKLSSIEKEIKELKSKRIVRIKKEESVLKKKVLKNINAHIKYSYNYYYNISIKNNTNYYIRGPMDIKVLSNGKEIAREECFNSPSFMGEDNLKDKDGFDMGYYLAPNSKSKKDLCSYYSGSIGRSPDLKLFVYQNKLPTRKFFDDYHIVPNKVVITNAEFIHKPVKEKTGSNIKYITKPVSFYNIAALKKYPEDTRISELEKTFVKINEEYKADEAYESYSLAKTKADICKADKVVLDR